MATTSVHKYWTSTWAKAVDNVDLSEMVKMVEMCIAQSHVLNCKLYKVLAIKVDELCSVATGSKDIDELRSENKIFRSRLAVSKNARAQAEFEITKSETLQRLSVNAQKQAELKLKVCKDIDYAKHKELIEALTELSKAKKLLAKLGASGFADPKGLPEK
ncbi:hypothetical protein Fot_11450 [Forsythia ovata]|uniref:Uncharacterized protein n=1 Tax=Forsythia ovata TaxID=205694 RepID=A0ABD1WNF8_9LAMI